MTDQSFPKFNRLLSRDDFQSLRPGSRRLVSGKLVFYYKFMKQHTPTRMGISVSKKVGNAVKRNRIKRKIREAFRISGKKNNSLDFLVTVSTRNFKKNDKESFVNLERSVSDSFAQGLNMILNS